MCPVSVLKEYVARMLPITRNHSQLLSSYKKPHKPVSETSDKWLKKVLTRTGIDIILLL